MAEKGKKMFKGWGTSYNTVRSFKRWAVVIVCAAAAVGWAYVDYEVGVRDEEISAQIESRLQVQTVGRGEVVRLWTDNLIKVGLNMIESDLVRLFAGEMSRGNLGDAGSEMSHALAAQKPYMEHTISEFAAQHGLVGAYMLDEEGVVYLRSEDAPLLGTEQVDAARSVINSASTSVLAVRDFDGKAVLDVARPIFMLNENDQPQVAGVLLTTHDVETDIKRVLEPNPLDRPGERFSLVQMASSGLEQVGTDGLSSLKVKAAGELYTIADKNNAVTSPVDGERVFMQAQRVKSTPFIVMGEFEADRMASLLAAERTAIKANATAIVMLLAFAMMFAVWFVLRRYNSQRTKLQEQTMDLLVRAMEIRDPYLAGHHKRLAGTALKLANKLNLDVSERATLYYSALLSGIGSIFVPSEILNKPGKLTAKERKELEAHIDHAAKVLSDVDFDLPIKPVIMEMYERMDGSGYPRRIKGDRINRLSRILGLSDVYCALTSPRAYRDALSAVDAFDLLDKEGDKFDTELLDVLKKLED